MADYPPAPWDAPSGMPPTTRWCLVGDGDRLYVLAEHSLDRRHPGCAMPEPDRGIYLAADPQLHPPSWLSPHAIGTQVQHDDGIAGFVWYLTMERDRARQKGRPRP